MGIEIDKGLHGFIEDDFKVVAESFEHWQPEFDLLCRLHDIYVRLMSLIEIKEDQFNLPGQLFLMANNSLYGVTSALLRRRTDDAQALMRRAIEGAGIAYRVFERPELLKVYQEAYPHVLEEKNPKQFTPTSRYREEFSSAKLFGREGKTWEHLKTFYDLASASASHAGIGALKGQKWKDSYMILPRRETSKVEVGRAWHAVLHSYWNVLKVFLSMLRGCIRHGMAGVVEEDMKKWLAGYEKLLPERTPWIPELQLPNNE